ncbi:MAG: SPFH domain-containing protein [Bifidobacteriaceae bacterium]|jgi:regulator of protease activity HflC (stomatin/prohibitin superfamily)|nr:SPFH domain-containing protein [Bifidobacteriaceae bacterium]
MESVIDFITPFIMPVVIIILVIIILSGILVVKQQTAVIIERLGKYNRTVWPGIKYTIPIIERQVVKMNLRVNQINIDIETKTKDNVFVIVQASTQYRVDPKQVSTAFYELSKPVNQIQKYMEDAIRSAVPSMTLDDAFEKKDEIAQEVQSTVGEGMSQFGFIIIKTLVTSIDPAIDVKEAMNSINAAQRQRIAAQELADADKIRIVTKAKAEAEEAELRGQGIADQRRAIVNGLKDSFDELRESGLDETQIMSILMTNQYLDSLNKFADAGNSTIFLPSSPDGIEQVRAQILEAIAAGKKIGQPRAGSSKTSQNHSN